MLAKNRKTKEKILIASSCLAYVQENLKQRFIDAVLRKLSYLKESHGVENVLFIPEVLP
jgi:hypothetical protein